MSILSAEIALKMQAEKRMKYLKEEFHKNIDLLEEKFNNGVKSCHFRREYVYVPDTNEPGELEVLLSRIKQAGYHVVYDGWTHRAYFEKPNSIWQDFCELFK